MSSRTLLVAGVVLAMISTELFRRTILNVANTAAKRRKHCIAYITAPTEEVAENLSRAIVEGRLAACVNIIPEVKSVYRWKGKVEADKEILLMVKTRSDTVKDLVAFVQKNHPYEVPEVITVDITDGNPEYLSWLDEDLSDDDSGNSS